MRADVTEWFLTAEERANDATALPAWIEGNLCTPLIHGAEYFRRLLQCVEEAGDGDQVFFTDWRGDPDERLTDAGPTVAEMLSAASGRGVCVRGLVWRSHIDAMQFSAHENRALDREVEASGGQIVLDQRVRRSGSHHQKLVVVRCPGRPEHDVAFVGGIDLCHSRRDDAEHRGDPQVVRMAPAYGPTPPWHDAQLEIRGPAVAAMETVFRERWNDPVNADVNNPVARILDRLRHARLTPTALPPQAPPPPPAGHHHVQALRTYPSLRPRYRFAPEGERSVARGYSKAVGRATRLVYIEDQYLWSTDVGRRFADALRQHPTLHLVVVVPRHPDQQSRLASVPNRLGQADALRRCQEAGAGRVHLFDLENADGTPIYVHAKVCVVDDAWATIGSDNLNRRSWTHDSELTAAVLDPETDDREPADPRHDGTRARTFARDLRLRLVREHLDREAGTDDDLVDPEACVAAMTAAADALDAWHAGGRKGERPPGRLRRHEPAPVRGLARMWAVPFYRWVHDPDGRPVRLRWSGAY
ncbi:MAG: phospholipase D/Transphosphatidylase [Nocardioidaceae bacterium]|nr:phospholipase D/Transphosphatidylase [Nocardioidaceae bacterium]